jgi:anti-sigma regulatory factor (Ser/Thr protein kinase)
MSLKDVVYEDQRASTAVGDTLILYTDGLVERRGESIDAGLERLQDAIRGGPQAPGSLCQHLLASAWPSDAQRDDDVTALVVRVTPPGADSDEIGEQPGQGRIQTTLTPDASAPAMARRMLERSFGEALETDELARAKLAISELTTNAVLHGQGEITVLADLDDTRLLVEVIDQGSGFEHVVRQQDFDAVGGRGLHIVDSETSRWGMHDGTTHVWFEIERRGPRVGTDRRPPQG